MGEGGAGGTDRTEPAFRGASAVVTGAASGIGAALVAALRSHGATVWAADRDEAGLGRFAGDAGVHREVLDVTDEPAVRALLQRVAAEHGSLDLVFNNAGVIVAGPMETITPEQWQRALAVNLGGVVHGTQVAYELMVAQGSGHIVNTASTAGALPVAGSTPYVATKHAVLGLSTALRAEARAARNGVRVSVVLPGLVETNVFGSADTGGGFDYQRSVDRVRFRKLSPEEAADAILAGVRDNRAEIIFPGYNRVIIRLYRLLPTLMSRVVNADYRPGG